MKGKIISLAVNLAWQVITAVVFKKLAGRLSVKPAI